MIEEAPILIVDDEVEMRIAMSAALKRCGYNIELSHNPIDALNKFKKNEYRLVITDMTMPKRSGVELLKDIKKLKPNIPVILVTAYGTIETAVESMKYGAFDYIQKPFNFDTFLFLIERALSYTPEFSHKDIAKETRLKRKVVNKSDNVETREIITQNKQMLELLEQTRKIAKSKATILVQSESGTGKELLARYIHFHSDRNSNPFVAVNCAALPETLLESELFGHKKGAFTGAINDHRGKFEQANGGSILLDEISEMALPLQAKLLRVLQEHVIDRVGGMEPIPIDIRVIATTNRNLLKYVEEGKFREDLYFRLNVIPLELPPLRERKSDITLLCRYFVEKFSKENNLSLPEISDEVLKVLNNYHWRGNIRELENVMERALLLSDGKSIIPQNLLFSHHTSAILNDRKKDQSSMVESSSTDTLKFEVGISMWDAERKLIFETLKKTNDNRTKAAEILGISIRTLRNKLNEYKNLPEEKQDKAV